MLVRVKSWRGSFIIVSLSCLDRCQSQLYHLVQVAITEHPVADACVVDFHKGNDSQSISGMIDKLESQFRDLVMKESQK